MFLFMFFFARTQFFDLCINNYFGTTTLPCEKGEINFSHINYHSLSGRDESHSMFFYKHVRGQSHIDFCFFSVIRTLLGGWVSFKDAIQNNKINIDF